MIGVIIQARTGSSRFPRKIYQDINGQYTLQRVLSGVSDSILPHRVILAMPEYDKEEFLERDGRGDFLKVVDERFNVYFGDPDDLVDRYFQAARKVGLGTIVRVTADCPMIQGNIIDEMLCEYFREGYNGFMGNNALISSNPYPDGTDVEIFPYWMLAETWQLTKDPYFREHVTPYMYRRESRYNIYPFINNRPNTQISQKIKDFSFDTKEDYDMLLALTKEYDKHGDINKAIKDAMV